MNDVTQSENPHSRCGFVAIVGRPNVGKSTLLNHVLGQKLSITSRKPQTTRHQILGIKTEGDVQAIYVDTPGMHEDEPRALNRYMNRTASSALKHVDVVVFVVDRHHWTPADEMVLKKLEHLKCPVILAVNKVDKLERRDTLLPVLEELARKRDFAEIIPMSALKEQNLAPLEEAVARFLPESVHFYPDDQITDRSERFVASEMVREKITRQLGAELPYSVAVEIEEFKHDGKTLHISALILVEREGQKKIVIGDKGERLRSIGQEARADMERMFESKVMLRLWVKVRRGWADSDRALKSLGMNDS
ncbi:GTP-binding protein Era [Marinobacter daqiaonensis]|uniref:GTPase Era n=1 Tax=Marinobacter daqiaonensis TaxID=650891 RepID=A0A1I6J7Z7_9GAMM|nr:GTPase Era [Marinobacter daqiaonensis]SFR75105.1 GTP-binding protein Era [Marinobacter daqiaonensis]